MQSNECPVCHRYFPVGLWAHIQDCVVAKAAEKPNGYADFREYVESIKEERKDA